MRKILALCFVLSTATAFPCEECIHKLNKEIQFISSHTDHLGENSRNDPFDVHSHYYMTGILQGMQQARYIIEQTHTCP